MDSISCYNYYDLKKKSREASHSHTGRDTARIEESTLAQQDKHTSIGSVG